MGTKDVVNIFSSRVDNILNKTKSLLKYVLLRQKMINLNMNIKGPYVIIPESGSFHK